MNLWRLPLYTVGLAGILLLSGVTQWWSLLTVLVATGALAAGQRWRQAMVAAWLFTLVVLAWTIRSPLPGILETLLLAVLAVAVVVCLHVPHLGSPPPDAGRVGLFLAVLVVVASSLAVGPQLWQTGAVRLQDAVTPAAAALRVLGVALLLAILALFLPRRAPDEADA